MLPKSMMKWVVILFCCVSIQIIAQEEAKPKNWNLNGYVKDMVSYTNALNTTQVNNLVHNRLNFKWYPGNNWKLVAELRTRIFNGDQLKTPFFLTQIDESNDYFKLSYSWQEPGDIAFHTMLDRLYLQYTTGKFETKLGRQRINWGINTVWNPNDIFNAFSYFDFDYEERPGSDAVLIRYYTGIASSIEVAGKMADSVEALTAAGLWKINYKGYDVQLLGGVTSLNAVAGFGWAGNLKKAGFKGEGTFFMPMEGAATQTNAFVGAISLDYSFKSSLYLIVSGLYSSDRSSNPNFLEQLSYYNGNISARNLSPYRWSAFFNAAYQFHPLVNGSIAFIGYPGSTNLFVGPSLTLSVLQNLDLSLFSQLLLSESGSSYGLSTQAYYLRLKYSF